MRWVFKWHRKSILSRGVLVATLSLSRRQELWTKAKTLLTTHYWRQNLNNSLSVSSTDNRSMCWILFPIQILYNNKIENMRGFWKSAPKHVKHNELFVHPFFHADWSMDRRSEFQLLWKLDPWWTGGEVYTGYVTICTNLRQVLNWYLTYLYYSFQI